MELYPSLAVWVEVEELVSSAPSSGGCWTLSSGKTAVVLLLPGLPSAGCDSGSCRCRGVMVVWNRRVSLSTGTTMALWVISVAFVLGMKLAQWRLMSCCCSLMKAAKRWRSSLVV